jgi:hypothetical protein
MIADFSLSCASPRLTEEVAKQIKAKNLTKVAECILEKNLSTGFGQKILQIVVSKAIGTSSPPTEFTSELLWHSDHPVLDELLNALIIQLKGGSSKAAVAAVSERYKDFVEKQLIFYQNNPNLLFRLLAIGTRESKRHAFGTPRIYENQLLEVWDFFFNQGQGFTEAIAAAKNLMVNGPLEGCSVAIRLMNKVVKQGRGVDEAFAIVLEAINDGEARVLAFELLGNIAGRGICIDEVFAIVLKELSKGAYQDEGTAALQLLSKVISLREEIDEDVLPTIIQYATNPFTDCGIFQGDRFASENLKISLDIWKKLINYPAGRLAAKNLVEGGRWHALDYFKGRAYMNALSKLQSML